MFLFSIDRNLAASSQEMFGQGGATPRKKVWNCRPRIEALEDRLTPSSVTFTCRRWTEAQSAEAFSHCWDQDPCAGGGYPWPELGDDSLADILAAPQGRIHFAGEQTTHSFGWIQGAMESGLRAAHEVHLAP